MHDVVILTDHRYENPKKIDWYIQQVLTEDNLLKLELEKLKLKVLIKDWKSKNFNWSSTKTVIFRSTWDYFDNYELFLKWLENTKSKHNVLAVSDSKVKQLTPSPLNNKS